MKNFVHSKKGFMLVELLVALAVLVLLVIGIGTSMGAASRVYTESVFDSNNSSISGIINSCLEDLLRYAEVEVQQFDDGRALASYNMDQFTLTNETYSVQDATIVLEDGIIMFTSPYSDENHYLVAPGVYVEQKIKDFSIKYKPSTGLYTVKYTLYSVSDPEQKTDVEFSVRSANASTEYLKGANDKEKEENTTVTIYLHYVDQNGTSSVKKTCSAEVGSRIDTVSHKDTNGAESNPLILLENEMRDQNPGLTNAQWFRYANGTRFTSQDVITDLHLYLRFDVRTITVTFDSQGGTPCPTCEFIYGALYFSDQTAYYNNITREGYDFGGWYTMANGTGNKVGAGTTVTCTEDSQTLYAHWTPKTYTIVFHDGTSADTQKEQYLSYGEAANLMSVASCGFESPYTVNFAYGRIESTISQDIAEEVGSELKNYHESVTGKRTFLGWSANAGAALGEYPDGTEVETGLYSHANTEKNQNGRYEIHLYAVWGKPTVQLKKVTDSVQPFLVTYEAACVGWYGDKDCNTTMVGIPGETVELPTAGAQFTYYSKWMIDTGATGYCTITFSYKYGNTVLDTSTSYVERKTDFTLPEYGKPGYHVTGWTVEEPRDSSSYNRGAVVTVPNYRYSFKMTCTATCVPNTITYHYNTDGKANETVNYTEGCKLLSATKTGAAFLGWYTKDGVRVGGAGDPFPYSLYDDNIDLYAHWDPYTVTLEVRESGAYIGTLSANTPVTSISNSLNVSGYYKVTYNGYQFTGWYDETTGKRMSGEVTATTGDIVLYARFAKVCTVTFNAMEGTFEGGEATCTLTNQYTGDNYDLMDGSVTLPTATRVGYTLSGWGTEESCTSDKIVGKPGGKYYPTRDITLYAQWTPKTYTVTFDLNGDNAEFSAGTGYASKTVTYGKKFGAVKLLPEAERPGYRFVGWFTEKENGTQIKNGDVVNSTILGSAVNGSGITLYAHWESKPYTVKLDGNGGSVYPSTLAVYFGKAYGTLPTPNGAYGMKFDGWYTSAEGGTEVTSTTTVSIAEDHTLYAHWIGQDVEVTFNAHTGNTADNSTCTATYGKTYGDAFTNGELPTPTRTGYEFLGWFTAEKGGSQITKDSTVTVTSKQMLHAQWKAKTYTVSFSGDTQTHNPVTVTFDQPYGDKLPVLSSTDPCYTFAWFLDATFQNQVTKDTVVKTAKNHTLYLNKTARTYTVSLNGNGGKIGTAETSSITVTYNKSYSALPTPTRSGYTFKGWYTSATGGSKVETTQQVDKTVAESLYKNNGQTLYAHWEIITYKIEYELNSGSLSGTYPTSYNVTTATFNLPTPTRTGYDFKGWYTTSGFTGDAVTQIAKGSTTGNKTFYAKWEASKYTITLLQPVYDETNHVYSTTQFETVATKQVTYNSTYASALDGVTMTVIKGRGYKSFKGWYTEKTGGTLVTSSTKVTITKNQTLYAQWEPYAMEIFFLNDGSTASSALSRTYKLTEEPTQPNSSNSQFFKSGYYFLGYYSSPMGGSTYSATKDSINRWTLRDNCDRKIYAYWLSIGGSEVPAAYSPTVTADSGNVKVTLPDLKKTGYTLSWSGKYWNARGQKETDGKAISSSSIANGVLTVQGWRTELTPVWTANTYTIQYASGGGSGTMESTSATYDANATLRTNTFKKDGYTFAGWKDASGNIYKDGQTVKNLTATNGETVTLTAQWTANTYTVQFNGNGYTSGSMSSQTFTYGTAKSLTANGYSRTGYTFDGWATSAKGNVVYRNEESVSNLTATNGGTVTLYAHWKANTYTVQFNGNGSTSGSMSSQTFTYGTAQKLNENAFSRTGYTFDGWATSADGAVAYSNKESVTNLTATNKGTVTLYAHWKANTYTITYMDVDYDSKNNVNKTTYSQIAQKTVTYDQSYGYDSTSVVPSVGLDKRTGYKAFAWYDAQTGGNAVTFAATDTVKLTGNLTLYGHWTPKQVRFNMANNNSTVSATDVYVDYPFTDSQYPFTTATTTDGYQFIGWYTASFWNGTSGTPMQADVSTINTYIPQRDEYLNVYAYWLKIDYNGATTQGTYTAPWLNKTAYKVIVKLPTPTRTGYYFAGWFDESTATYPEAAYNTKEFAGMGGTEYAIWHKATLLKARWLKLDACGGTYSAPTISNGVVTLPTPTRTGYTFQGWYTAETGGTKITQATYTPTGSETLYAQWTANTYTISYDPGTGSGTMESTGATYGADATLRTNTFKKDGYTFAGWKDASGNTYTDGQTVKNLTSAADGKVTLTAQWTANTYKVKDSDGNELGSYLYSDTDARVVTLNEPTMDTGWEFTGYTASAGTVTNKTTLTIPAGTYGDITVTAEKRLLEYEIKLEMQSASITVNENEYTSNTTIKVSYGSKVTIAFNPKKSENKSFTSSVAVQYKYKRNNGQNTQEEEKTASAGTNLWSVDTGKAAKQLYFTMPASTVTLQAYSEDGGGCFSADTMITMADGTQKPVEEIKLGDMIQSYSFYTGEVVSNPVASVETSEVVTYQRINVTLESGKEIGLVKTHSLFDADKRIYFDISVENCDEQIGKRVVTIEDGKIVVDTIESISIYEEKGRFYSIITAFDYNAIANDILTVNPIVTNIVFFDIDENFVFDQKKMEEDIAKYGLSDYSEWEPYMSREAYEMTNVRYLNVLLAKTPTMTKEFFMDWLLNSFSANINNIFG